MLYVQLKLYYNDYGRVLSISSLAVTSSHLYGSFSDVTAKLEMESTLP